MKTYWSQFRTNIFLTFEIYVILGYTGGSLALGVFSQHTFRGLIALGFFTNAYSMYLRRIKMAEMQNKIEPIYEKQIKAYSKFFHDEGYDEDEDDD